MNNSYITIIKEKRTDLSRKRIPLNQNRCTADFRMNVPFEQNLQKSVAIINNKLDLYRLYHYLCLKYIQKTSQDQNPERFVNLFEIVRSENV